MKASYFLQRKFLWLLDTRNDATRKASSCILLGCEGLSNEDTSRWQGAPHFRRNSRKPVSKTGGFVTEKFGRATVVRFRPRIKATAGELSLIFSVPHRKKGEITLFRAQSRLRILFLRTHIAKVDRTKKLITAKDRGGSLPRECHPATVKTRVTPRVTHPPAVSSRAAWSRGPRSGISTSVKMALVLRAQRPTNWVFHDKTKNHQIRCFMLKPSREASCAQSNITFGHSYICLCVRM